MRFRDEAAGTLEAGGIVVTSTARAARAMRRRYAAAERARGLESWVSPRILDWDQWLSEIWRRRLEAGSETRLLLSREQEHRIWSRLVAPSIEGAHLISTSGVADLALRAYSLLATYNAGELPSVSAFESLDVRSFLGWAESFTRECARHAWVSRSLLEHELEKAEPGCFPGRLLLTGFDRMTPAAERLIGRSIRCGTAVERLSLAPPAPLAAFVCAQDPRQEIGLCAQWVARALGAFPAQAPPQIAVITADQAGSRDEIERIFRETLASKQSPLAADSSLPFEFSLGVPLSQMPVVRAALALLRWMKEGLRQEDVTWLLLSGFLWKDDLDLLFFSRLDADKRRRGFLPLDQSLDDFLRDSRWQRFQSSKDLQVRFRKARKIFRAEGSGRLRFDQWAELSQKILSAAGWPGLRSGPRTGSRHATSEEFQVQSRWARLIDTLATLSFDDSRVEYGEFLNTIDWLAGQTIFSAESHGAPVQILGPHEAAGMEFDFLWFLGADDRSWPPPGDPHPFLPRDLEEQRGMPHAGSGGDWELSKLVTDRLRSSSGQMIASYAAQTGDGSRRPSTLFSSEWRALTPSDFPSLFGVPAPARWPAPALVEVLEPARGPAWPPGRHAGGGASLLKSQAACPFQAFAAYRLGARALDPIGLGLNPRQRGSLLHKALAAFWEETRDSDALQQASASNTLRNRVERSVSSAIAPYRKSSERWLLAYLDQEQQRLTKLIEEWLALELARPAFTVEQTEEGVDAVVGGVELTMRADRIDKTGAGRLLIDYKTGDIPGLGWEDDRPDEPQLPLYAAYGGVEDLAGVVLAQIRTNGLAANKGAVRDAASCLIPGRPIQGPIFSGELRSRWQAVLARLMEDFAAGSAAVDPKRFPKTCEYCALQPLCRIAEQDRLSVPDDVSNDMLDEEGGFPGNG